ncbi:MAG: OmpA family protein [Thiofilum sp.]|uniref:OmpA family protein n=1 Tax=Thiofilum sp. TaxID=2212733 RepID=UPI0025EF77DD|nr:OmpA family protein [Thiofilum sp.]MBK8455247.1 OmpA family protein [Thiofilum sp.]
MTTDSAERAYTKAALSAPTNLHADSQDLERLRLLLLGSDYIGLLALKNQLQDVNQYTARVASVLAEAIQLRSSSSDNALVQALTPSMDKAVENFIHNDPQRVANALYPVMGPAIRKSIHETLAQTLETFNQLLEQSLSPRSIRWRFDAWRTGRKYSEVVLMKTLVYQVEQVFLIHRETSLLLQHVVSKNAIVKDPDMVSSMLSAIQDFMADSFTDESSLNALRLGELSVLIEQGPYAAIAAVVRGTPPAELRSLLIQMVETIHQRYDGLLKNYSGDSEPFAPTQPLLQQCLQAQRQDKTDKTKQPWLAYGVLALVLAGIGYWAYNAHVERQHKLAQQQLWEQTLAQWDALPGIVILGAQLTEQGYQVKGLRDPLVPASALTLSDDIRQQFNPSFIWQPYITTEPSIALKRAQQLLSPPAGVELTIQGQTLYVRGNAEEAWVARLKQLWIYSLGLEQLDTSQLISLDSKAPLNHLINTIRSTSVLFEHGSAALSEKSMALIEILANNLKRLEQLALEQQLSVQVTLVGSTDSTGTEVFNRQLGLARAQALIDQLSKFGVSKTLLVAAIAAISSEAITSDEQRSVTFKVVLQSLEKH